MMQHQKNKISHRKLVSTVLIVLYGLVPSAAIAQSTPTELASISFEDLLNVSVTTDQNESKDSKRWKFGYAYRSLSVGGYKSGSQSISFDDVLFSPGESRTLQNYPVVPTFIDQEVHAFSAKYACSNKFSVSLIVPIIEQSTDHISIVPGFDQFILSTKGLGDIALDSSYHWTDKKTSTRSSLGLRLPTGSINELGDTPRNGAGTLERLPYTMQLGSGTYDISFAINRAHDISGGYSVGGGFATTIRTGINDNGYRLGDTASANLWFENNSHFRFQPIARIGFRHNAQISGADTSLLVPGPFQFPASITDPDNFGGEKITASFAIQSCAVQTCDHYLTAEFGRPLYQDLNGIQPKKRNSFSISVVSQL